jgi:hypothetical protein
MSAVNPGLGIRALDASPVLQIAGEVVAALRLPRGSYEPRDGLPPSIATWCGFGIARSGGEARGDRFTWERAHHLAADWLPQPRNFHPWPNVRFAVKHSR